MLPTLNDILNNLGHYTSPATVRKNHPELYEQVVKLPYDNFSKKLHAFYHGAPKSCSVCGKPTKYVNFRIGYRKYCSKNCMTSSEEVACRRRQTNLERYGVEYVAQRAEVRQKMMQTNLERYGVPHALQSETIKSKLKQTNLERYGAEWTGGLKQRLDKVRQTNLERYGTDWYMGTTEFIKKSNQTKISKYGSATYHNVEKAKQTRWDKTASKYGALQYDGYHLLMPCSQPACNKCTEKSYTISLSMYIDRCKYGCECCTRLFPPHSADYGVSAASQALFRALDETLFEGLDTYYHSKTGEYMIGKYRLDYFVPEMGLCIEFYGDYWHANPTKFAPIDRPIPQFDKTAQEIWDHDSSRVEFLNEKGISVIVVWASDLQSGAAIEKICQQIEAL